MTPLSPFQPRAAGRRGLRPLWLLLLLVVCCSLARAKKNDNDNDNDEEEEEHKRLLPLGARDLAGAACAAVAAFLAAGGGVGGGGILVPIYIVLVGFSAKAAIPLSNVTIFGASIMNTVLNVQKRHPLADKPMIDWDLMLMMQPSTIVGAILGAFINVLLPAVILIIMLVVVLAYTTFRTVRKGLALFHKESAETPRLLRRKSRTSSAEEAKAQEMVPVPQEVPSSANTEAVEEPAEPESTAHAPPTLADVEQPGASPELKDLAKKLVEEDTFVDWRKPLLLAVMLGVVNLMTGMASTQFECGSGGYWALNVSVVPLLFFSVFLISKYLIDRYNEKVAANYPFLPCDVKWDHKNTLNCAVLCVVAGILAGMFGIGGGMIQGPLMLEMGVHPQAVAATSASLILYTSATATISFWLFGMLREDYAIMFFIVGFLATWGGQISAQKITDLTGRQSFIIFLIAGIIVLSTCLMTYVGIAELVEDPGSVADAQGLCD